MAPTALNKNNSAVKRIMQEARELANDPSPDYSAAPLEDDIFEWHCTIRGPADTEFEGGLYHLRIILPSEYPFRPPSLMLLTPNGRFETNSKICISFTNYHEELWQPAWGIRTAILGIQGFFPLKGSAAVGLGSIEYPAPERRRLAALSREWVCTQCEQSCHEMLPSEQQHEHSHAPAEEEGSVAEESSSAVTITSAPSVVAPGAQAPVAVAVARTPSPPATPVRGAGARQVVEIRPKARLPRTQQSTKPPLLLDAAICGLLLAVFVLLCRRVF